MQLKMALGIMALPPPPGTEITALCLCLVYLVLVIKPRTSCMVAKHLIDDLFIINHQDYFKMLWIKIKYHSDIQIIYLTIPRITLWPTTLNIVENLLFILVLFVYKNAELSFIRLCTIKSFCLQSENALCIYNSLSFQKWTLEHVPQF